ncbi:MAG: hypothetical protein IJO01_01945 [Oscillospiraceae bacterium]|nr:hypothetical protein [Oscillospiraceae bacterium]
MGRIIFANFAKEYILSVEKEINGERVSIEDFYLNIFVNSFFEKSLGEISNLFISAKSKTGLISIKTSDGEEFFLTWDGFCSIVNSTIQNYLLSKSEEATEANP